jgi:hypothetical protein
MGTDTWLQPVIGIRSIPGPAPFAYQSRLSISKPQLANINHQFGICNLLFEIGERMEAAKFHYL